MSDKNLAQILLNKLEVEEDRKKRKQKRLNIERRRKWRETPITEAFCELFKHVKGEKNWKTLFEIMFPEPPSKEFIKNDMLELDVTCRELTYDWESVVKSSGIEVSYYGYINNIFEYIIAIYLTKYFGPELTRLFCHDHHNNKDEIDIENVRRVIKRIKYEDWNKVVYLLELANLINLDEEDTGGITLGEGY